MQDNKLENVLSIVAAHCRDNPKDAPLIVQATQYGLSEALDQYRNTQVDLEVALSVALAKRYKGSDSVILNKLKNIEKIGHVAWKSTIELIEKKLKGTKKKT